MTSKIQVISRRTFEWCARQIRWCADQIDRASKRAPLKYLIITYLIVVRKTPVFEWKGRRINPYAYCTWAVALVLAASVADPIYQMKASWVHGLRALSLPQLENAVVQMGLADDFILEKDPNWALDLEQLFPGSTHFGRKVKLVVGTLDPYRVGAFVSQNDASSGQTFVQAIELENRKTGLLTKALAIVTPFIFMATLFPVHWVLAPKKTPYKETAAPYLIVVANGLVAFAFYKVALGGPADWFLEKTDNSQIAISTFYVVCIIQLVMLYWIMHKHVVYLKAAYQRSTARTIASVVLAYSTGVLLTSLVLGSVGVLLDLIIT